MTRYSHLNQSHSLLHSPPQFNSTALFICIFILTHIYKYQSIPHNKLVISNSTSKKLTLYFNSQPTNQTNQPTKSLTAVRSPQMDWRRGRILGHGSTATVSLASSPTTTQLFAVKSAPLSKSQPLQLENHLFSSFITPSPYIISYHGHTISHQNNQPPSYNLFIEYLPGGILTQIHNPSTIQLYTWRILMGIHHLHSLGIVHGDIKPTNILIGVTGPKIADFGCAHLTHNNNNNNNSLSHHHHHFSGTPLYMAPEVARGEKQDLASDIWSFGITIIEMITGKSPWTMNFNPISFIYKIGYCTSNHQPNLLDQCLSEHAKDFLTKCLMIQPNQRWTAAELLKHPFLNRFTQPQLGGFQQLKFQFPSSNSPTSVLEQGFSTQDDDDDDQEEDIYTSSSFMSSVFLSENVGHRMLALFDSEEMVLPKWELDDQDWITIR